jgi:hypothetical protein
MKADRLKNLYAKTERLTITCRISWAWFERVTLYSRQIVIPPEGPTALTVRMWKDDHIEDGADQVLVG